MSDETIPGPASDLTTESCNDCHASVKSPASSSQTEGKDQIIWKRRKIIGDIVIVVVIAATVYLIWAALK
jgi:hypothetical protein